MTDENKLDTQEMSEQRKKARRAKLQQAQKSLEMQTAENEIGEIELTAKEQQQINDLAESDKEAEDLKQAAIAAKKNQEALKQAKQKVNPAVPSEQLLKRPSYGHLTATATLHSYDAYRFVLGREATTEIKNGKRIRKPKIIGLFEAGSRLKIIQAGYRKGCPYAAATLIEIEKLIAEMRSLFVKTQVEAENLIKISSAIKLDPFVSKNPTEVPLWFGATYSYHYSDLLAQYDLILRPLLNYRIHRFISYEQYSSVEKQIGTPLRRLFRITSSWSYVGKEAVVNKTAKLQEAEYKMGILTDDIISGKLAPTFIKLQGSEDDNV